MAEKGIVVNDAASGESIGCRDAYELDDDSNARIIQLIDQTQRQHQFDQATATGRVRQNLTGTACDGTELSTLPTRVSSSALICGDKTTLVVASRYQVSNASETITVTPIVLDDDNTAIGFLQPKILTSFKPAGGTEITQAFNLSDINIAEILTWNVFGAYKVGIHVAINSTDGTFSGFCDIYAKMISGPSYDTPIATRPTAGTYTSEEYSSGEGE